MNYQWEKYYGCLLGGAIGDALGYPIEFLFDIAIRRNFGFVDHFVDKPYVSDDTQMSLYTAVGALTGYARRKVEFNPLDSKPYAKAYLDWYFGQMNRPNPNPYTFLPFVPALNVPRAPGNTCLSALGSYESTGSYPSSDNPINTSKGCGGVMRVAPIGLFLSSLKERGCPINENDVATLSSEVAAITHGGELGYIPAGYLGVLIYLINHRPDESLLSLSLTALDICKSLFEGKRDYPYFESMVQKAIELSSKRITGKEVFQNLGEGWVGEEALALSLYFSLTYKYNFKFAISHSVNHSGDSDSTGAITGNILGCYLGYKKIASTFEEAEDVEHCKLIKEVAYDLMSLDFEKKSSLWGSLYKNETFDQPHIESLFKSN